ncbi:MAG: pro-sigmaK processing inhibitor BofA family protein [Ruminococcus sp.]|nr:pro-sigmaK processing inhibitor BofA family protein [Ruminococcus sp.]
MKQSTGVFRFVVRALLGTGLIFVINQYVLPEASSLKVGLNLITLLTSGTLGIPGVGLLYGILLYQSL